MKKLVVSLTVFVSIVVLAGVGAYAESLANVNWTWGSTVPLQVNGRNVTDWTVEFNTNLKDNNGDLVRDSKGNLVTYTGFCVDITQPIGQESVLPVTLVAPSQVVGGLEVAWLIENRKSYQSVNAAWSAYEIAGLQIAIWEVRQDYNAQRIQDLTVGNFKVQATAKKEIRDLANYYLTNLRNNFAVSSVLDSQYRIAQNPYKQDLILNIPAPAPIATPEPGTLVLVGLGLLAVGSIARKQR